MKNKQKSILQLYAAKITYMNKLQSFTKLSNGVMKCICEWFIFVIVFVLVFSLILIILFSLPGIDKKKDNLYLP